MSGASRQVLLFGLAIAGWLGGFAVLARWGTWLSFAVTGPGLAVAVLVTDAGTRALLRPSLRALVAGVALGALMTAVTRVVYAAAVDLAPAIGAETRALFSLFEAAEVPGVVRAGLIAAIASSEELLFRGAVLDPRTAPATAASRWRPSAPQLGRLVALSLLYALSMLPLGSALLVAVAFVCGLAWGLMRITARSLWVPIAAHLIWDLSLLVWWPLVS